MAPRNPEKLARKNAFIDKLKNYMESCPKVLIVHADHVGSKQMQEIRIALRGKAHILMGKNTMVRVALKQYQEDHQEVDLTYLLDVVKGNIGFIFCIGDAEEIRKVVLANKVPASAKAGVVAPIDVTIHAGPTGLDPAKTNFFQALNIATKIVKGQIEIVSDVPLLKQGTRVQMSEQVLLQTLKIHPFSYSLQTKYIYENGNVFSASVLDITDSSIIREVSRAISYMAAFSREIGIPTEASAPHAISNAFKNMSAVCATTDITFPEVATLKEFLKDPSKFAKAAAPASPKPAAGSPKKGAKAAAKEEEEEDAVAAFSLFD